MPMNVQIEEISACRRKLQIEVPAEEVSSEYNEALKAWVQNVNVPGFRAGKAPVHLVKARHHKDIVERLRDHILPKSYREAIEENKIQVVQIIDMDEDVKVVPGEAFSYSITVDVQPEIALPEYKGIPLSRNPVEVTDAELEERIDALREQRASYEEVSDRPVCRGDMVQIDFTATLDGTPLSEAAPEAVGLDKGDDFWLQADANAFIPELGEGLAGLSKGESTDINVHFDGNFSAESLRDKDVVFHVAVKSVRGRVLPELDEAFLKPFQVENADAFRAKVKESIASDKKSSQDQELRRRIETFLMENTSFELPESAVDEAANRQLRRIINDMTRQGGNEDQVLQQKDQIVEAARGAAANQVKMRYVLLKIAEAEGLNVTEAELKREMAMMAYAYGMKPADLEKELSDNQARNEFRGDVLMRKTLELLFDQAAISE